MKIKKKILEVGRPASKSSDAFDAWRFANSAFNNFFGWSKDVLKLFSILTH